MARTKTKPKRPSAGPKSPQAIARDGADRYFAAIVNEIPFDGAPIEVNLIEHYNAIRAAIERYAPYEKTRRLGWEEEVAMHAGYLLGVEIGKRIGGLR